MAFPEPDAFSRGSTDTEPRPASVRNTPFVQEGSKLNLEMQADLARADKRAGLPPSVRPEGVSDANGHAAPSDAVTRCAWRLAEAVIGATEDAGFNPSPTDRRLTRAMAEVFASDLLVFLGKQMDYGPGNISAFGVQGVAIRSHDKTERIRTLLRLSEANGAALRGVVKGEAVEDTFGDQTNYGAIARLVLRGEWPEFEE